MKGQHSLFSSLFDSEPKQLKAVARPRNFFMPERNRDLIYRYYFYIEIKYMRYDKVLEILEREFYITEARLIDILNENRQAISAVIEAKPTIKDLQKLVTHFNWSL
jgi:hypothetical protein